VPFTAGAAAAGATREARERGRAGSTIISIFIGRSVICDCCRFGKGKRSKASNRQSAVQGSRQEEAKFESSFFGTVSLPGNRCFVSVNAVRLLPIPP
jgi:hypothetical protein